MKAEQGRELPLCDSINRCRTLDDGILEVSRIKDIPNVSGKYYVPITLFEYTPLQQNIKILGVNNNCRYKGKKLFSRYLIEVK